MSNLVLPWFITYVITLFVFDVSPGVSFVMTAKNTIKNKSLAIGCFTALGVATSDALSAIIGFFFCSALEKYASVFKIAQLCGMAILFYIGANMLTAKQKELSLEEVGLSVNKKEAYKSGFVVTVTNIGIATVIVSVISQFYKYIDSGIGYFILLITVPIVSFLTFCLIACGCYFLKLWKVFGKYAWLLDKIAGIVLIALAVLNVIEILK